MFDQQIQKPRPRQPVRNTEPASPPVWPMPTLNGRAPVVIPSNSKSPGLALAYQRANVSELLATYPVDSANGTARHFMPNMMPAFAVRDGVIMHAGKQAHGYAVVVDHRNGWATYYANLEFMFATPTDRESRRAPARVKAGDVLGYVGAPAPGAFKCLHFELWKMDEESHFGPADAREHLGNWIQLPWTDERFNPSDAAVLPIAA